MQRALQVHDNVVWCVCVLLRCSAFRV